MAGNRLGPKQEYIYRTDVDGQAYIISRDEDLALAGLGVGAAAPEVYDPDNIPAGLTVTPKPVGFKPRVVYVQSTTDGARKAMIAFSPSATLYETNTSVSFPAIDTDTTFVSTGRRGEQLSF